MIDRGPLTTHVLDTSVGRPGVGISITLARKSGDDTWETLSSATTDADGRAGGFVEAATFTPAIYRLTFATGEYYRTRDVNSFYPTIAIEFQVSSTSEHYHVPLLLSPHGYTTYRGS